MGRARACDPTAGLPMESVVAGLGRLYTLDCGQLVPQLDLQQVPPVCPITMAPFENPVLLEDGFVYEQAAIMQWLESNTNAPCTNIEVKNFRVLRLEPFQAVVNRLLQAARDDIREGWRTQLLKVQEEATCSTSPLVARCVRVERAIAACMTEVAELEVGLEVARCIASRLRTALRRCQEGKIVTVQRAARCWLARRQLRHLKEVRALKVLKASLQTHRGRWFLYMTWHHERMHWRRVCAATTRIQQWWKQQLKKMAKRAKRRRMRQSKKARAKTQWHQIEWGRPFLPPEVGFAPGTASFFCKVEAELDLGLKPISELPGWGYFVDPRGAMCCLHASGELLVGVDPRTLRIDGNWRQAFWRKGLGWEDIVDSDGKISWASSHIDTADDMREAAAALCNLSPQDEGTCESICELFPEYYFLTRGDEPLR